MRSGRSRLMMKLIEERNKEVPITETTHEDHSDEDCIPGTPGKLVKPNLFIFLTSCLLYKVLQNDN